MISDEHEQDELWDLLGKARPVSTSPFFARNVLREIRLQSQERPGFRTWLAAHWRQVSFCAAAACALLIAGTTQFEHRQAARRSAVAQAENQQIFVLASTLSKSADFQVISHLDELLDSEKDSVWLDNEAD